ncbi:globin family protein [Denitratisoma sp. agr-D3]
MTTQSPGSLCHEVQRTSPGQEEASTPETRLQPDPRLFREAGAPLLRRLVRRHHERLRLTYLGHAFPDQDKDFQTYVDAIADNTIAACGGPARALRKATADKAPRTEVPIWLTAKDRAIWLAELWQAMADVRFPADLRQDYWDWAEAFSLHMIRHPDEQETCARYPYAGAGIALARHMSPVPAVFKAL